MLKRRVLGCCVCVLWTVAAVASCVGDSTSQPDAGDASAIDATSADASNDNTSPQDTGNDTTTSDADAKTSPTIVELAAGQLHACALFSDGHVDCWGDNSMGQLGVATAGNGSCVGGTGITYGCRTQPVTVGGITNAKHIAAGTSFTCAIDATGAVLCWGLNNLGQLGHTSGIGDQQCTSQSQTYACNPTPTVVTNATSAVQITLGAFHACFRSSSNTVGCWGDNSQGEIGNTSVGSATATVTVPTGLPGAIADIRAGVDYSTCAVTVSGGEVWCWGFDDWGQCGAGGYASYSGCYSICIKTPQPTVQGAALDSGTLSNVASVYPAHAFTCAEKTNGGAISCWGIPHAYDIVVSDASTGVGIPPTSIPSTPAGTFVLRSDSACVVADGGRSCWGSNYALQLGDGTSNPTTTPKALGAPADLAQLVGGYDFYIALDKNGKVFAWGGNEAGELGHAQLSNGDVACGSGNSTYCNGTPVEVKPLP